jgi:predicted RNase H-like nuclease
MTVTRDVLIGVDGCPGGWLVVREWPDSRVDAHVYRSFHDLLTHLPSPAVIAIDIPIGLPEQGSRACDEAARKYLGFPRMCSVFPAPIRPILAAGNYADACRIRHEIEGKKVSKQVFGILPKVREVDEALTHVPMMRAIVTEVHPELSFAMWKGHPLLYAKRRAEGQAERRSLIEAEWPGVIFKCHASLGSADYQLDDLHDALAALWSARRIVADTATRIPSVDERDRHGLPMRIVA